MKKKYRTPKSKVIVFAPGDYLDGIGTGLEGMGSSEGTGWDDDEARRVIWEDEEDEGLGW